MPGTRNSDYILKVELDAQLWGVMYIDCHVKGSLEPHTRKALDGPRDNPFHGLVKFSLWEFVCSEIIKTICSFCLRSKRKHHGKKAMELTC